MKNTKYKTTMYYLASPYTHDDIRVRKLRADQATMAAIDLFHQDVFVFAPIPYNAPWEGFDREIRGDWEFWEKFDKAFIDRCEGLIVLTLDGWKESKGVTAEVEYAKKQKKPVVYLSLEQIENGELPPEIIKMT